MNQPTSAPTQKAAKPKRRKLSQERAMLFLVGFFITGVVLMTIIPEDTPLRGIAMALFSGLLFFAFFKWAM